MKTNIKYGFISSLDKKQYIRRELNNDKLYEDTLFKAYYLQSPKELLNSKCGLCFDQVEFERTLPSGSNGIYRANSLEECLDIYKNLQFKNAKEDINQIELYPYENVQFGLNFDDLKKIMMKRENEKVILKRNI